MHSSFTPKPLSYGQRQTCTVGVPWPNEVFYYAIVSVDEAGNRSPISNIISVYISEGEATEESAASSEDGEVELYEGAELAASSPNSLARLRSKRLKTYIAVGVVSGLVLIVVILVAVILIRVKTRRAQYDAERKDSYKAYEPNGEDKGDGNGNVSTASKNLSSWLDSLPRSERGHMTSEDVPDMNLDGGETLPKQHTLTKTNPYRHKVLTNGSFLNLKDLPAASSGSGSSADGDSRPTTSTEDSSEGRGGDGGSSQHSADVDHFQPADLEQGRRVRRSKSSGHHQQLSMQQQQSPSVLDTSTARAIIDTYSGNLFSDNYSNYVPYGSPNYPQQQQQQQHDGNYAGYNNGFDRYSVGGNVDYSPQRQSFRMRTESVV